MLNVKEARKTILSVKNLKVHFNTRRGVVKALNDVNFSIYEGESYGLVGETGCGKSVTALSILGLVPFPGEIVSGEISFMGESLLQKSENDMRKIRGSGISMIFQDPTTYLNPVFSIGDLLTSVILLHLTESADMLREEIRLLKNKPQMNEELIDKLKGVDDNPKNLSKSVLKKLARAKAIDILKLVKLADVEKLLNQYPHELSGGMRQRVLIAMMLSCNPKLVIADEATTNLDVTIKAQILELLRDLRNRLNSSFLVITHDLGVVAEVCDKVSVMYAGVIVETADVRNFFKNPIHPYTKGLLKCIPRINKDVERLEVIHGTIPHLISPPSGCRFHPRCPNVEDICGKEKPKLIEVEPDHFVACHRWSE